MKKNIVVLLMVGAISLMVGCSKIVEKTDEGQGELKLLTSKIKKDDNLLEFKTNNIDESKIVFMSVANKVIFKEKIKNNEIYQLDISDVEDAHRTDYEPKVQLFQTKNNKETGEMITFKQVRYKVEK